MNTFEKKIIHRMLLGLLLIELAISIGLIGSSYLSAAKSADAIFISNRNILLTGDLRLAKRGISASSPNNFVGAKYISQEGRPLFSIDKSIGRIHLPVKFPFSINLNNNSSTYSGDRLVLTYDLLGDLEFLLVVLLAALLFYFLISIFLYRSLNDYFSKQLEVERKIKIAEVSQQVAHDIKSPLGLLKVFLTTHKNDLGDKANLLSRATVRIDSIVADLENPSKKGVSSKEITSENIHNLLKEILCEKLTEKSNLKIDHQFDKSQGTTVALGLVNKSNFSRILSNIINNSIDAASDSPEITIQHRTNDKIHSIKITDNGEGIPKKIQSHIFKRGKSYGKVGGQGLGLFFAKENLHSWGGSIKLLESSSSGTTFEINIKRSYND